MTSLKYAKIDLAMIRVITKPDLINLLFATQERYKYHLTSYVIVSRE